MQDTFSQNQPGWRRHLYHSGTSGAAALVSGVLALEVSSNHEALHRLHLISSSQDLGPPGFDKDFGFGVPSALEALFDTIGEEIFCFPSEIVLSSQEERTLFFISAAPVSFLTDQSEIYQLTKISQGEASLIGLKAGEGHLYLYQKKPFAIKKIKVRVTDYPYHYLESIAYPLNLESGWLGMWAYRAFSDPEEDSLKLSFTYWEEEEGYYKAEIPLYGGYFEDPFYELHTIFMLKDVSFFPQGLYECLLVPQDVVEGLCQKRAFFIKP